MDQYWIHSKCQYGHTMWQYSAMLHFPILANSRLVLFNRTCCTGAGKLNERIVDIVYRYGTNIGVLPGLAECHKVHTLWPHLVQESHRQL